MKALSIVVFMFITVFMTACSSTPKREGFQLPVALSETFRGGALKGMEHADSADIGMPAPYDMVEHTCTSAPIFDAWGRFVRTDVRCW